MRKDKTTRNLRNKILTISMSIVLFACVVVAILAVTLDFTKTTNETGFNPTTTSYSSNQAEIIDPKTTTTSNEVTMTDAAADISVVGDKVITISNATELQLFSSKCKDNTAYLAKSYKLLSNIKYDIINQFIPVGYNGTAFSGTFDGNGYDITNLKLLDITSQIGNASEYSNMQYYAMFSVNTGTIINLGLIEPKNAIVSVELDNVINNGGAATLVGDNKGTIEYCYLKDLRDLVEEEIGLAIYGNYRIASFVYLNEGTFKNCYAAISGAANHKINGYESLCSLCYQDNNYNASNSHLYYYDESIESYNSVSDAIEITYKDDVFSDATFLDSKQNVGIYCASLQALNANFASDAKWYLPSKYDASISQYIKNNTAILRGLTCTIDSTTGITNCTIASVKDFLYMFELMNGSDFFAGDKVVYTITKDINLLGINPSTYAYSKIVTSTITSNGTGGTVKPKLATNATSAYPTIYNFDCIAEDRKATTLGIDAYGLFPYLGGTISYLNIVPSAVNLDNVVIRNNVKAVGAVSGYVEKGHITNVNVYIQTTHESTDIKEFYLGGVAGILGGEGTIDNCTSAGSFTMNRFVSQALIASAFTRGNAIGGVVGYVCETYGNVKTCLSAVNMTLNMNSTSVDYQIGGVIGAAYTIESEELENIGTINVGTSSSGANYRKLYLAGVIGRHVGVKNEVKEYTNQGAISLYGANASSTTYISGVENADIKVAVEDGTGLIASTLKTKDGKYYFNASSLTNRANVSLGNATIAEKVEYTSGINVLAQNGFVSDLTGVYNLNYTEKYVNGTKKKATLGVQNFDLLTAHKYSGAVNVVNGTTPNANYTTNLDTVYNLREFKITASDAITGSINYEYYGTVRGKYINYNDVRNEGAITATIENNIGTIGTDTVNIRLIGVLEEVSEGCNAEEIFNGKDISLTFKNASISGNVVASGICLRNKGYDANTIDQFNPSSNDFDSKVKGALDNVINNGKITVDNPTNFGSVSYSYANILSGNNASNLGSFPYTTFSTVYNITGDIFTSGIVTYNEAPITNTFNLGDIFAVNYINDSTIEREINAAGIAGLNIGKYAYILNSANNGDIKAINLSTGVTALRSGSTNFDNCTPYKSNVNASGIVARNDELENGDEYSSNTTNPHSSQIISFTINYGDIYSYNFRPNFQTTAYEPSAKSSGIVAMGLLNTINVLNYGNIYSSETASGIFGVMYFTKFDSEVTASNKVSIANTINYGNVYMLTKGYNHTHGNTYLDYNYLKYSQLKSLTTANVVKTHATKGNIQVFTEVARNSNYLSIVGSIFSLANYATSQNSKNIVIRYLISFNDACPIVGETVSAPYGVSVATNTLYSAHVSNHAATGASLNDKWINNYVEYAPLITGSTSGSFVTSIDSSTGVATTANKTYYGIFNSNFAFQKAILGKTTLDLTTNPTDAYLTDYFEFVGFKYINPILFEKIGWQTFAYKAAADDFATNVENVYKLLGYSTNYTNYKADAKNAFAWMNYSISDDLDVLIDSLVANESYDDLLSVLEYIYSDDSQSSIYITTEVRTSVLDKILDNENDLLGILNSVLVYENGYSQALAESLVVNEDAVKEYINDYIQGMTSENLTTMLNSYITYLEAHNNGYFNYENSEQKRIELLTTLFTGIDDATFYKELVSILGISDLTLSDSAKMFAGYQTLSTATKKELFQTIVTYNYSTDRLDEYIDVMASDIDYFAELNANGYNITSLEDIYAKADLNSASTSTSTNIVSERVKLWNLIKNTSVFTTNFSTFNIPSTMYFKATEYNNTYQSVTEPHNTGAYVGDTSENRLSYLYTTDITPAVYFYGPYTEVSSDYRTSYYDFSRLVTLNGKESGRRINNPITNEGYLGRDETYHSLFHSTDASLWSTASGARGNDIMLSRGGQNSQITYAAALNPTNYSSTTVFPVPMLIYYDFNNEQLGGANEGFTLNASYYSGGIYTAGVTTFRGFWNDQVKNNKSFTDPMLGISCKSSDWVGTLFGPNDLYMRVSSTGEEFSLNNASVGPQFFDGGNQDITLANGQKVKTQDYRCYIKDSDGANHLVQANESQTIQIGRKDSSGNFTAIHTLTNYSNGTNYRAVYSFLTYVLGIQMWTSTVNTTYHSTGRTGIYRHSGQWDNYFTWKQSNGTRVFTSQYIDYSYADLYNLDGVLTEFDKKTYSDDERFIINYLFNTYFLTSSNWQTFRKLVEAALLESLGSNETRGAAYIDNFLITNIYATTQISGSIPFAYLQRQSGSNNTVQYYLNANQSLSADNKKLLIYGASGNQSQYINLIKRLKAARSITPNNSYANLAGLLNYLTLNQGYISNDKIVLSNLSSLNLTDLTNYLSCFDDDSDVTITSLYDLTGKMSAYTGVVTKNQQVYDNTTYNYGLKFSSMTLTPASTDTRIIMLAKSTDSSSTLTKGSDTVNVTTIGEYYFETGGATSVTITSNSDVIVYNIYFVQDVVHNNQQTTLNGTVLTDGAGATYFTVTKTEIETQINTAITNSIGNNSYYKITAYSVVANVAVQNVGSQTYLYFASSNAPTTVYANSGFDCYADTTTNATLTMQDAYYNVSNYVVYDRSAQQGASSPYLWSSARNMTSVSYTIIYSYLTAGSLGTTNKTATSSTVNLYDSNVVTGQTYTSDAVSVNANTVTLPSKATIQSAIATAKSLTTSSVIVTGLSATFTMHYTQTWGDLNELYIYDSSNNSRLGRNGTEVERNVSVTITINDLTSYYGQTLNGKVYSTSFNAVIDSYTYTATYTIDPNTVSVTLPTLSDVQALATAESGIANPTITASSLTITARNRLGSAYDLYLYDNSGSAVIANFGNVAANSTASVTINLANYYGKTVTVRFYQNGGYYTESNKSFIADSYYYTATYQAPNYTANSTTIYKNRLLNLDVSYSDAQNKYLSYIYNNSANAVTKYNTFINANLTNFAAYNTAYVTASDDENPTNLFVNQLSNAQKIAFAKLVIQNNNESLYAAIKGLCSTKAQLGTALKTMDKASFGYAFIADAITKLDNMPSSSASTDKIDQYADVVKALIACYIVANYRSTIDQGESAYNTKYRIVVDNVNTNATGTSTSGTVFQNNIQYINNDGSFNSTAFDLFVEYVLRESTATTSYGIFALASSRGIQNGAFIPDNVDLTSMDAKYDTTKKISNVSYIELTDTNNSSWRDKTGTSSGSTYITSNTTSVNYYVRVEMKQLVKAISNVIFELDLECDDTTLYSSTNQIDYENKIITYYVSEDYLYYIKGESSLNIINLVYADTATSNKDVDKTITLNKTYGYKEVIIDSTSFDSTKHYTLSAGVYSLAASYVEGAKYYELNQIDVAEAVIIYPEERAYTAKYTVRFIRIDNSTISFVYNKMKYLATESATSYSTTTANINIPYYGAIVTFKVDAELPNGMDLKSFFSITNQQKNVTWEFDPDTDNNGIVSNNTAYIAVNIDISMSKGRKAFVLNLYGTTKTVNITKDANRNALITSFGYDGHDYTSDMQSSSKSASSTILFGRAFNYDDLTKPYILTTDTALNNAKAYYTRSGESDYYAYTRVINPDVADIATYYEANPDFYLYAFEVSSNATVKITATKSIDNTTQLMTYDVTYSVKSEYGTATPYTHTLTEHSPFDDGQTYALLYKEGDAVDSTGIYQNNFYYGDGEDQETIYGETYSNLTYNDGVENFVAVKFNRGSEPQYRIKYYLTYFYGDISKYSVSQGDKNVAVTAPQDTYAGITITLDDDHEPGTYKYTYVYNNTGNWDTGSSGGEWITPIEFDPNAIYYIDLGDGYELFSDALGEDVTAENFDDWKDMLAVYQTTGEDPTYTRTYEFPALYIVKDFAVDALFHKLTFLDESVVLGGTASVMLPTTPISAGDGSATDQNTDEDAVPYSSVFANYTTNSIMIEPNQIVYSDSAKAVNVSDYYTVGTVSDTDLENYAPTIKVEKHAQVFKYTTMTKLTTYGADNNQSAYDSTILSNHNDILLYVPFVSGTGSNASYEVFLVLLDSNLNWKKVYSKDYTGRDETKLLKTYSGDAFNTADAEADPTLTTVTYDGKNYQISEIAGQTDVTSEEGKNLSLFMDYIGDPLEDHFWYVSYVVFSEYYLNKGKTDFLPDNGDGTYGDGKDDLGAVRYYHISIVDASNTVYFDISLYAPDNFKLDDIYLTLAENVYEKNTSNLLKSVQLSCYVEKQYDENNQLIKGTTGEENGLVLYKLKANMSMAALPAGYFYFYIDLPNGYGASCYTSRDNENDENAAPGSSNKGAYLPHTTIIPITIGLKIIVSELTGESSTVWAVNTSDLYTRKITYKGKETAQND